MYPEFKDKVVLITGGNSGMGKATALAFAANGAKVVIAARNSASGAAAVKEIMAKNGEAVFIQTDVADADQVKHLIDETVRIYGRIDIAFNNAGVDGERGKTGECSLDNWHQVMNVNLNGVFYCMKYQTAQMIKQGSGCIVNNSSVSGLRGYATAPAYIASKHGVTGLTKAAALEYAPLGIRINAICPGLIYTPMVAENYDNSPDYQEWCNKITPLGRIGQSEEIAETVMWLCSDKSSFITGQNIVVDGGVLIK